MGYELDDWQRWCIDGIFSTDDEYRLCASLCLILVARQNGKNVILEVIELYAFYVLGWREILHTAHLQDSSAGHMARLRSVIEGNAQLDEITKFIEGNGKEKIVRLDTRAEIRFMTRSKKIGRSKSPRLVVIDEALFVSDEHISAMLPSLAAQSMKADKPLFVYTSSAPVPESWTLHNLIARFVKEEADGFFADWGAPAGTNVNDREAWYASNPGLGIRISEEWIETQELMQLTPDSFAIERLGVVFAADQSPSELPEWPACADVKSRRTGRVSIAVDVALDLSWSSIVVAAPRDDGLLHVEVAECLPGTAQTVPVLVAMATQHNAPVFLNPRSEAGGLIADLNAAGVQVVEVGGLDFMKACVRFRHLVTNHELRHIDQDVLNVAVAGAATKALGDGWVFAARTSHVDVSPLIAAVLAAWGTGQDKPAEFFIY